MFLNKKKITTKVNYFDDPPLVTAKNWAIFDIN